MEAYDEAVLRGKVESIYYSSHQPAEEERAQRRREAWELSHPELVGLEA